MNLTQRQLRMFVTTAAVGNISRASEALHISQPALTRALQEFESQLGVALFLRTTRQLALTPEGERFLPVAQRLQHDLTEAAAQIQDEATGQRGSVCLAVGEAFGCTVLPDILQSFVTTHPGVRVRVVNDNSQGITRRVAHGEVDFGIGSPVGRTEALRCTKLLSAPLGLLFNPQLHQLKAWVRTETLGDLPLLKEGSDTSIVSVLRAQGSDLVAHMGWRGHCGDVRTGRIAQGCCRFALFAPAPYRAARGVCDAAEGPSAVSARTGVDRGGGCGSQRGTTASTGEAGVMKG